MNSIKMAMFNYFAKLIESVKLFGDEYLFTAVLQDEKNILLVTDRDNEGWCGWLPVEKDSVTDFSMLEDKYSINLHQDIKDYYNQYWFYDISGDIHIDDQLGDCMIQLEKVLPDREIQDLDAHIERYYLGGNINNFRMVPIGFLYSSFVVVDNVTAQVFIDDRFESGNYIKIAENLADLISRLVP